mmetsp:Transcript_11617/g.22270  ORF Transcript_11617/g.22270 Transcript_11617/m.22270 type:complete len:558 (-) Transcript_11617:38-1711(-)
MSVKSKLGVASVATASTVSTMSSIGVRSTSSVQSTGSKTSSCPCCSVCGKLPFRQPETVAPQIADQEIGFELEAGVYEFIYRTNQENKPSLCLPVAAAKKTAERCTRHTRRLQNDLIKASLLNSEGKKISESGEGGARIIAPFSLSEIHLGRLLGTGGFSAVFEVQSLNPDESKTDISIEEQKARKLLQFNAVANTNAKAGTLKGKQGADAKNIKAASGQPQYAIKHLRRGLMKQPEKYERAAIDMVLEAQLLLAMDHPNIISLRGWSAKGVQGYANGENTDFFMIMDKLSESLDERLLKWRNDFRKYKGRTKLPWSKQKFSSKVDGLLQERLMVVHNVTSALEYMHERRIINRDLKASNVGFDMKGDLKLFDFGLSRLLPSRRSAMQDGYTMSRVGTKYYMAPEVRAKAPYNLSADVYSFGVVYWEIMSLSTPRDTLQKARTDELRPSRRCMLPICECWPSFVQSAIERCLSNDPHVRPKISDIRDSLANEMVNSGVPGNFLTPRPPSYRLDASTEETSFSNGSQASTDFRTSLDLTSECESECRSVPSHAYVNFG